MANTTDDSDDVPTFERGDRVKFDGYHIAEVVDTPENRSDGMVRIQITNPEEKRVTYLNRRPDLVEPVDDADDEAEEAGPSPETDGGQDAASATADADAVDYPADPVDAAETFEKVLTDTVETALLAGVNPADASTVMFGEANRIAACLWTPTRDKDAEVLR